MSEFKGTPGPWHCGTDINGQPFIKGDGIYEEILSLDNARIMAASTDLLEALQEADRMLWLEGYTVSHPAIIKIEAAIAKALQS